MANFSENWVDVTKAVILSSAALALARLYASWFGMLSQQKSNVTKITG